MRNATETQLREGILGMRLMNTLKVGRVRYSAGAPGGAKTILLFMSSG